MNDIHFYSAYAKTDINAPFQFELEELEIKEVYSDGTIELRCPYFYRKDDSSRFFGGATGHELDKELKLNFGSVYYSTDKDKCKDYLIEKMRQQNEFIDRLKERMRESKLIINVQTDI